MDIYEEYKDSGIDWVGKVPASWKRINSPFPIFSAVLVLVSEGISVTFGTLA